LVQLAGRAGRTAACPTGRVIFLAARASGAMREATRLIAEQNELAARLGLLDSEPNSEPGAAPGGPPRGPARHRPAAAFPALPPLLGAALRDLWYSEEERCLLCSEPRAEALCPECRERYFLPDLQRCAACGKLLAEGELCRDCAGGRGPRALAGATALGLYDGAYRDLLRRVKYRGQPFALSRLAPYAARHALRRLPLPDCLAPTPLHDQRLRGRGYNQAEALASFLGGILGLPVCSVLRRARLTVPQSRLTRAERLENVRGAFVCDPASLVKGRRVWLIDDVLTTGATADACAEALRAAGSGEVFAFVLAAGREG
jgi:ComF family protein